MAFELSFALEFFVGPYDFDGSITFPVDRPTSVYQAVMSLAEDKEKWAEMVETAFDPCDGCEPGAKCETCKQPATTIDPEDITADMVMSKIEEVNTCTDLRSPVSVWIDSEGYCTVEVY